eukprot:998810-Amorphochlora_amoeboformis.AAC.2
MSLLTPPDFLRGIARAKIRWEAPSRSSPLLVPLCELSNARWVEAALFFSASLQYSDVREPVTLGDRIISQYPENLLGYHKSISGIQMESRADLGGFSGDYSCHPWSTIRSERYGCGLHEE